MKPYPHTGSLSPGRNAIGQGLSCLLSDCRARNGQAGSVHTEADANLDLNINLDLHVGMERGGETEGSIVNS